MKKMILVVLVCCFSVPLLAQQRLHQHHIGTQAEVGTDGNHTLIWTVGEVVNATPPDTASHHITAGFLQHRMTIVSAEEHTAEPVNIFFYPNPVKDELHIQWSGITESLNMDVYDLSGQLITSRVLENMEATTDVSELEVGMYLITLKDSNNKSLKTFKVHKTL
ncbi:T9SS type A sorting domain-containing protein [bacterium SCSIO 12741]|nr:T9SS type A sorting domain-containing protein [bacterium SCSIO 12741]